MRLPFLTVLAGLMLALLPSSTALAETEHSPLPDLTARGTKDDSHDWNLGPTGARGRIWADKLETTPARQILITRVDAGSPADGCH